MINLNWCYRDLQVIRLENEFITIDVLPELGAKIYNSSYASVERVNPDSSIQGK